MTQLAKIVTWVSTGVVVVLVAVLGYVFRDQLFTFTSARTQDIEAQISKLEAQKTALEAEITQLESGYSSLVGLVSGCNLDDPDSVKSNANCAQLKALSDQLAAKKSELASIKNAIAYQNTLLAESKAYDATQQATIDATAPSCIASQRGYDPNVKIESCICSEGFTYNGDTKLCDTQCTADETPVRQGGRIALCCPAGQTYDSTTGVCAPPTSSTQQSSTTGNSTITAFGTDIRGNTTQTIIAPIASGAVATLSPNTVGTGTTKCATGRVYNATNDTCDVQCVPQDKPITDAKGSVIDCAGACTSPQVYSGNNVNGTPICLSPSGSVKDIPSTGGIVTLPSGTKCPEGQIPDTSGEIAVCKNVCPQGQVFKGVSGVTEQPICESLPTTQTQTTSTVSATPTSSSTTSVTTTAKTGAETPLAALFAVLVLLGGGVLVRRLSRR